MLSKDLSILHVCMHREENEDSRVIIVNLVQMLVESATDVKGMLVTLPLSFSINGAFDVIRVFKGCRY